MIALMVMIALITLTMQTVMKQLISIIMTIITNYIIDEYIYIYMFITNNNYIYIYTIISYEYIYIYIYISIFINKIFYYYHNY